MSILEWNSKWRSSPASLTCFPLTGLNRTIVMAATSATSSHITSTFASQTASSDSSLTQALPSGASTTNPAVAAPGVATKHSLTWRTRIGPVIGGLIGALCLCIGIAVLMAFRRRRRSNIRATKSGSCRVKAPIPGPENTDAEMTEKPIVIPLQPTYSRGVISFDIASDVNEHGHSSADSRLTMGSETTAEFYVNSVNIPSPFSTNFRASVVTRIRDLEEVDPSIRPGRDGSSTLFSYSAP